MTQQELSQLAGKYLSGNATTAEKEALDRWYYTFNPQQLEVTIPAATDKEEQLLAQRMKARLLEAMAAANQQSSPHRLPHLVSRISWRPYLSAAAVLLLAVLTWAVLRYNNKAVVQTALSKQQALRLPDGTEVWLNADSRLEYDPAFKGAERKVILTGEAYFNVAQEAARPFMVVAGGVTTRVLGTAFNIRAYPGQPVSVTVTQGKVQVQDAQQHNTILAANEQVRYQVPQAAPETKTVKAVLYQSWINGQLDFDDQSFEEIAATLHRRYNVNISFSNAQLKRCRFTANFEKEASLSRVLTLLGKINGTGYNANADSTALVITGNGCEL
jgi:ferric-dicitrate binding protein FerR (iron transport regulator)